LSSASGRGGRRVAKPAGELRTPVVPTMISIGYGNLVAASRVISIVNPGSSPMRRLREQAVQAGRLIDATEGRRTRSILVTDSGHVILSAINPETIAARMESGAAAEAGE